MNESPSVDREFQKLIPPLRSDEYERLEASIVSEGCRDALIVWEGKLLDGHNRKEICDRLGKPYRTKEIKLADRLEAKIWIRRNQLARRNLNDDQRAMNVDALIELETKRSKAERAAKGTPAREAKKRGVTLSVTPSDKVTGGTKTKPSKDTRKELAKAAAVPERKVRQARAVRLASPTLAAKVESGEINLAAAVREVKRAELVESLESISAKEAKAIEGVYDVVVIDPPWPMEKIERDERPNQSEFAYPVMQESELAEMKLPCDEDCHVWIWTTHKFLPMALRLLETWGLKYVCTFVWHKSGGFQPIGLPQFNCEFALYARKGSPKFVDTKAFPVCFSASRGKHSEKPEEFYDMVRRVTAGRRIDMFSRRKIKDFDGWGKEA